MSFYNFMKFKMPILLRKKCKINNSNFTYDGLKTIHCKIHMS